MISDIGRVSRVFIGIGSNLGDRLATISRAIQDLGRLPRIRVVQMATLFETQPIGGPLPQPDFLNTVVEIDTDLPPLELLDRLQDLERSLGRQPSDIRWAPRAIDLDILLYDQCIMNDPRLTIPHVQLHRRRFALEPLAQLAPDVTHPVLHQTIRELLASLPPTAGRVEAVEPTGVSSDWNPGA